MCCAGMRTIQSKQLKIYTVDILGREAQQKATRSTEEKVQLLREAVGEGEERGGTVFTRKPMHNCAVNAFCFGHHISWYEHVFTLQMLTNTCLTSAEVTAYFAISKIQYYFGGSPKNNNKFGHTRTRMITISTFKLV